MSSVSARRPPPSWTHRAASAGTYVVTVVEHREIPSVSHQLCMPGCKCPITFAYNSLTKKSPMFLLPMLLEGEAGRVDEQHNDCPTSLLHGLFLSGCPFFSLFMATWPWSQLSSPMQHSLICSRIPSGFFSFFFCSGPFNTAFFVDIPQICVPTLTYFLTSGLNCRHVPNQTLYPSHPRSAPCPSFPTSEMREAQTSLSNCSCFPADLLPQGVDSVILPSRLTAVLLVLLEIRVLSPQFCAPPSKKLG